MSKKILALASVFCLGMSMAVWRPYTGTMVHARERGIASHGNVIYQDGKGKAAIYGTDFVLLQEKLASIPGTAFDPRAEGSGYTPEIAAFAVLVLKASGIKRKVSDPAPLFYEEENGVETCEEETGGPADFEEEAGRETDSEDGNTEMEETEQGSEAEKEPEEVPAPPETETEVKTPGTEDGPGQSVSGNDCQGAGTSGQSGSEEKTEEAEAAEEAGQAEQREQKEESL